jgi:hypothetical protein
MIYLHIEFCMPNSSDLLAIAIKQKVNIGFMQSPCCLTRCFPSILRRYACKKHPWYGSSFSGEKRQCYNRNCGYRNIKIFL